MHFIVGSDAITQALAIADEGIVDKYIDMLSQCAGIFHEIGSQTRIVFFHLVNYFCHGNGIYLYRFQIGMKAF